MSMDAARRRWLWRAGMVSLSGLGALSSACQSMGPASDAVSGSGSADANAMLDDLERRTFNFFWETTDASSGLAPDRWPTPSFCSVAAVGFALTGVCVGVSRGWITRAQGRDRVLTTLKTFRDAPQGPQASGTAGHQGFFYHFLDMGTGTRFARCELSTVDTALLLAGMLCCQSYFDGSDTDESRLRAQVDDIYARVDWSWAQVRPPLIGHGWHPETGFIASDWKAYDESMLVYLLALGSPGKALDRSAWDAWTSGLNAAWGQEYGQSYVRFPPLFGHQFTPCWVDLRGVQDDFMRGKGMDYFENSRRATLAQRAYAIANPQGWAGYGADIWGVSACDGPADVVRDFGGRSRKFISYAGRGMGLYDDGTIAPYAAGSSIAFAPEVVVPALTAMKQRYGSEIYGRYGFVDAFNPSFAFTDVKLTHGRIAPGVGWVDTDHLGIDQGPLLAMLGNYRGEVVWQAMRRNAHLRRGLERAGFRGGWLG